MYSLYVYGTLRPGGKIHHKVAGTLYDLGWFPGLKLDGQGEVICEKIKIPDFTEVDRYEGYFPGDEEQSLFIRRPHLDGYIYEYNGRTNPVKRVLSGDWLDYRKEKRGEYGNRF